VISSIPAGPITFAIIQGTLNSGKRNGLMIAIGAIIVEMFFCFIAVFGFGALFNEGSILEWFHVFSIPVLILLGFLTLLKKEVDNPGRVSKSKVHHGLFLGATLCFTNPIILGYWTFLTAALRQRQWLSDQFWDNLFFILGIFAGISIYFLAIIEITSRTHSSIPVHVRRKINLGMGIFFIGFGLYLGLNYFLNPHPNAH
jgi:threonine/homoserine/homoserine lactone efflux protein